jgi:hypothetical protein
MGVSLLNEHSRTWDIYADAYNYLIERMMSAGIEIDLLDEVIVAHEKALSSKNSNQSYQSIYQSQLKNTV